MNTIPIEHDEQVKVIQWCDAHPNPRVSRIYSHLNGLRAPIGAVIKAKASGGRKGIPDLFLPIPCGQYHGLYIEMKRLKGGSLTQVTNDLDIKNFRFINNHKQLLISFTNRIDIPEEHKIKRFAIYDINQKKLAILLRMIKTA